jgi:outer membrane protein OmpA-like peptidoglycan-associated protein
MLDELGRQTADKKMDAVGLATLLHEQREEFIAAVPEDLMPRLVDKLGLQQLVAPPVVPGNRRSAAAPVAAPASMAATPRPAESKPAPAIPVSYATEPEPQTGSALVRWGGGALVLLVLLGIAFMVWRNNQSAPAYNTETSGATEADSLGADTIARSMAVPTDPNAPGASTPGAVPTGQSAAPTTELTSSINAYLADTSAAVGRTFPLTAVSFLPGSSSFVAGSDATITDLVNLLRTHPTAQIRLVGYANDAGGNLTNKQLSVRRVNAIKQQLVDAGINFIRVDALGLGSGAKKVVLNDSTTVTRGPSLRKIDLKVVVK